MRARQKSVNRREDIISDRSNNMKWGSYITNRLVDFMSHMKNTYRSLDCFAHRLSRLLYSNNKRVVTYFHYRFKLGYILLLLRVKRVFRLQVQFGTMFRRLDS